MVFSYLDAGLGLAADGLGGRGRDVGDDDDGGDGGDGDE